MLLKEFLPALRCSSRTVGSRDESAGDCCVRDVYVKARAYQLAFVADQKPCAGLVEVPVTSKEGQCNSRIHHT